MAEKKSIGVVGSGQIGRSWAMLFAGAGFHVKLYDTNKEQVAVALSEIRKELQIYHEAGILRGTLNVSQQLELITGVESLKDCVKGSSHVQECIPESVDLKKKLFREMDDLAGSDTVLSSSTSSLAPSHFTGDLNHKENCIVSHPISPPYIVRLIEIVPAPWTSPEIVSRTRKLMDDIGQAPIVLNKEVLGFGVNRIQLSIMNECFHLVNDGVLSAADVDTLMVEGLGPRYAWQGPLETVHLLTQGLEQSIAYFGPAFNALAATFRQPPSWSKEDCTALIEQTNEKIPLNTLDERRTWRNERLMALANLKQTMSQKEKEGN